MENMYYEKKMPGIQCFGYNYTYPLIPFSTNILKYPNSSRENKTSLVTPESNYSPA